MKAKVLIIGPSPPPFHGVAVATKSLICSSVLKQSFRIVHLDTKDPRGLSNIGRFDLGNVYLAIKHGVQFLWLLVKERPIIVYVPISQAALPFLRDCLFLVPSRLLRRKVIIHLHGGYFQEFYRSTSPLMRWVIRFALGKAARAIVLGKSLTNLFDGIIPRDRIRVVPNGIPDFLKDHKYEGPKGNPRKVLYLSTLMKEKGFLDVLQAVPLVINRLEDVRFIFVGEWFRDEDRQEAMALIERLGIEPYVEFKGPIGPPLKYQLFQEADVFVFPSYYVNEGQPFVILEAMCAGLPIITTDQGAIRETVLDGVNGFIVPKGDPKAIAEKIVLLLRDHDLRHRMGVASRERFLAHYTLDRWANDMLRVFQDVLEEKKGITYESISRG